jgi:hypothetical protein
MLYSQEISPPGNFTAEARPIPTRTEANARLGVVGKTLADAVASGDVEKIDRAALQMIVELQGWRIARPDPHSVTFLEMRYLLEEHDHVALQQRIAGVE